MSDKPNPLPRPTPKDVREPATPKPTNPMNQITEEVLHRWQNKERELRT
jgi:hypothetical protein